MFTLILNNEDEVNKVNSYISNSFNLENIYIKNEDNTIIFSSDNFEKSCMAFSLWLSSLIINLYEKDIIKKIIKKNYFYFENSEQEQILNISSSIIDENSRK